MYSSTCKMPGLYMCSNFQPCYRQGCSTTWSKTETLRQFVFICMHVKTSHPSTLLWVMNSGVEYTGLAGWKTKMPGLENKTGDSRFSSTFIQWHNILKTQQIVWFTRRFCISYIIFKWFKVVRRKYRPKVLLYCLVWNLLLPLMAQT